jgi:hypothetical protein
VTAKSITALGKGFHRLALGVVYPGAGDLKGLGIEVTWNQLKFLHLLLSWAALISKQQAGFQTWTLKAKRRLRVFLKREHQNFLGVLGTCNVFVRPGMCCCILHECERWY